MNYTLVVIRRAGEPVGIQVRVGKGAAGESQYFSVKKCGSLEEAKRMAEETAISLGYEKSDYKGGGKPGRLLKTNKTGIPGIQLMWDQSTAIPRPYAVVTWREDGVARRACRSITRHGPKQAAEDVLRLLPRPVSADQKKALIRMFSDAQGKLSPAVSDSLR